MKAGEMLRAMRELPLAGLDDIAPGTVAIVAPHPDDESLGCGGLIAALADAGRPPVILCVTDGAASHPGSAEYPPARLAALRREELIAAMARLGVAAERVHFLNLPDSRAAEAGPDADRAVREIARIARASGVSALFATWPFDPHGDHKASARMARQAASDLQARLFHYPVWGWLLPAEEDLDGPAPQGVRFAMGGALPRKRAAIAAHASQYSDLIKDSPDGFRLPANLLAVFDRPYEVFLTA